MTIDRYMANISKARDEIDRQAETFARTQEQPAAASFGFSEDDAHGLLAAATSEVLHEAASDFAAVRSAGKSEVESPPLRLISAQPPQEE